MYKRLNKKTILSLIIILIIIEIIFVAMINLLRKEDNVEINNEAKLWNTEKVEDQYTLLYFNNIINKFFEYISERNAEALIAILDKDYLKNNSLNQENILKYFAEYQEATAFETKEVYTQQITFTQIYKGEYNYINGTLTQKGKEENIFFLIKEDYINSTFNISIISEEIFKKVKKSGNMNNSLEINIERNNYNKRVAEIDNL